MVGWRSLLASLPLVDHHTVYLDRGMDAQACTKRLHGRKLVPRGRHASRLVLLMFTCVVSE